MTIYSYLVHQRDCLLAERQKKYRSYGLAELTESVIGNYKKEVGTLKAKIAKLERKLARNKT